MVLVFFLVSCGLDLSPIQKKIDEVGADDESSSIVVSKSSAESIRIGNFSDVMDGDYYVLKFSALSDLSFIKEERLEVKEYDFSALDSDQEVLIASFSSDESLLDTVKYIHIAVAPEEQPEEQTPSSSTSSPNVTVNVNVNVNVN